MPLKFDKDQLLPIYIKDIQNRVFSVHNQQVEPDYIFRKHNDDKSITDIGCYGEMTVVFGHKKSRKSTLVNSIMASIYSDNPNYNLGFELNIPPEKGIIYIDTEMPPSTWDRRMRKLNKMCGFSGTINGSYFVNDIDNSIFLYQKGYSSDMKLKQIEWVVENWEGEIGLIVVDQLGDLVKDINDRTEAIATIEFFENVTQSTNAMFLGCIHATRGTEYMTGALGSEWEKKVNNGIYCEKMPLTKHTKVTHILAREGEFKDFHFGHDVMGYPILVQDESKFA